MAGRKKRRNHMCSQQQKLRTVLLRQKEKVSSSQRFRWSLAVADLIKISIRFWHRLRLMNRSWIWRRPNCLTRIAPVGWWKRGLMESFVNTTMRTIRIMELRILKRHDVPKRTIRYIVLRSEMIFCLVTASRSLLTMWFFRFMHFVTMIMTAMCS